MNEPIDRITQEVLQVAADVLGLPLAQVTEQTSPGVVAGWDSVRQLMLVLALESEFGVTLEPEDVDQIRTVGDAAAVVRRKRRGQ